jgi:four helix bundle protein
MKYVKDIKDWTKGFAIKIVKLTIALKKEGIEYALRDQLLRSGTSIGANVKEAKASSSRKELIRYYEIALKSCDETEFWIEVIREGYEMNIERFTAFQIELKEITKVIVRIIINLKK